MRSHALSDQELQAFHDDGFVRLGQVINNDELHELQQRIDDIMLGKIHYDDMMMQLDSETGDYGDMGQQTKGHKGATLKYRKIEQLEKDPLFLEYLKSPIVSSIAHTIIGDEVSIFRSMFMNKPAGFGTLLPWHQDGGRIWGLDKDPEVTIWLALDPATKENGCVQIVRGSHKLGLLSEFGHTISEEQEQMYCTDDQIEFCELKAGEAFLMHNLLLHRSDKNNSQQSRRAFSLCIMDAATKANRDDDDQREFPKLFGQDALALSA